MEDQERLAKLGNTRRNLLLGNVVEQGATDAERLAGERHLDFAFAFYVFDAVAEQAGNVGRIERRGDGHDCTRFGDAMRRGEHRRPAQAVAD